jgi:hypothetical protein
MGLEAPNEVGAVTLSSRLEFDDSPPQANHCRVSTVVGTQFGENALDSTLDGFFRDRQSIGNLLVGVPFGDQVQDTDFAGR